MKIKIDYGKFLEGVIWEVVKYSLWNVLFLKFGFEI